ncbi:phosphatase PAP2 family protein [Paenibacillus anaericanus]|uniref:Phosphatase PAP2 family protein n=1 Tax=Paenibacillus anaericanus TaxID=170367 RepID=A0A3S1CAG5_9BACL|nr:phosphatase PAP2 family protein [Paenibacillus anaericanus]RUT47480.1 phosphatase PAP2 family protein [Paenibacillus anaericanus]
MSATKITRPVSALLLTSIVCAILFGLIATAIGNLRIEGFDHTIITFIQGLESPLLTSLMKFFTWIGGGIPVATITLLTMVVLYVFLRHRKELIFLSLVVVGSVLINSVLKLVFSRSRPTVYRIIEATGYSFPSGHSMFAFSFYGVLAFLLWRHVPVTWGRVLLIIFSSLFILLIGISRIYLGVHYPSDVLGAYLMSGCWLTCSIWWYQRWMKRGTYE